MRGLLLASLVLCGGACERAPTPPRPAELLDLYGEAGAGLDLSRLRWSPAEALRPIPGALPGRRLLEVQAGHEGRTVRLQLPGACSRELELLSPARARLVSVGLRGRHGAGNTHWPLGPGRRGILLPGVCPEDDLGPLEWMQVAGPPSSPILGEGGRRVSVEQPDWPKIPEGSAGVVPRSPGELPTVVLRGRLLGLAEREERELRFDLLPRATGFPALAPGQRVLLAEPRLGLERAPGRRAVYFFQAAEAGRPATFQAMSPGRYVFRRPDGSPLQLSVRRHDHTRMDCARAECHPGESAAYARSAMATIGRRGLEGELGATFDPRCAIACHGTAEPGLPDGGALHVARELDFALPARGAPGTWSALPRDLRRVAGIGCTPCHGPGSLPEHQASWVILRTGVCATCHDAPPRYPRVQQWRAGAMSRADADPASREPGCAHCHTTGGFLESLGHLTRPAVPDGEPQPGPTGIACAACHAPHREGTGPALLRQPPVPAHLIAGAEALPEVSRVCLPCHASDPQQGPPRSSVADLLLGGRGDPEAASAHAGVEGSCLGCHSGHDFSVNPDLCRECHPSGPPEDTSASLRKEAGRLLGQALPPGGRHLPWRLAADPARARAYRQAALVAADRAAGVHGAPRARALLEAARSVLDSDP